jgi:microcystin degradation protein MlrC
MTGQGPRKSVGHDHWSGRLNQAREFRESACSLVTLESSSTYNPAITLMVACAIAYADAITAKTRAVVNTQDHSAAPRLLREVLGNKLPDRREKFYRRLLGRKDEVNYGARSTTLDEARRLLSELDDFAEWAESVL